MWARSASKNHEKDGGWSGMPGHVRQSDTDLTLLQEELNAPISRPLWPNFAIGPPFLINHGGPQPLNGRGRGEREVGIDRTN